MREAIEQTLVSLKHGRPASGLDTSLQGGRSTDGSKILIIRRVVNFYNYYSVLAEASHQSTSNEYLTLKEKLHKVSHSHFYDHI